MAGALRFLIQQNCWYLISGFSMLLGCFLMSQAPGADSVELGAGVRLQSVVWLYQLAVVGLAIFVRRRLSVENDAFNLACVAMVLLLDPTDFSERFWGHSKQAGVTLNAAGLLFSAALLALLREAGRFPIGRRDMAAWLATLTLVYGAGAGFEPGDSATNGRLACLLALAPLALASLAAPWKGVRRGETADEAETPSLAAHPVLWGTPGRIYRTYLAALVFGYPSLIVLRHLDGLSAVFGESLSSAHLAPAVLALGVLIVKAAPGAIWARRTLTLLGGVSAWMATATGAPDFPMFQLMLAANVVFGLWTHSRRGLLEFPTHAAVAALVLVASMTSGGAAHALQTLHPAPLALAALLGVLYAVLDGGFWEGCAAAGGVLLLAVRLSGRPEEQALGMLLHGLGLIGIVMIHAYPRKDLDAAGPWIAGLMLASLLPGVHAAGAHALPFQQALGFELALFLTAGLATSARSYIVPCALVGGFETLLGIASLLRDADIARLVRTWSGPAAILFSFGTLGLGLAGTRMRSGKERSRIGG